MRSPGWEVLRLVLVCRSGGRGLALRSAGLIGRAGKDFRFRELEGEFCLCTEFVAVVVGVVIDTIVAFSYYYYCCSSLLLFLVISIIHHYYCYCSYQYHHHPHHHPHHPETTVKKIYLKPHIQFQPCLIFDKDIFCITWLEASLSSLSSVLVGEQAHRRGSCPVGGTGSSLSEATTTTTHVSRVEYELGELRLTCTWESQLEGGWMGGKDLGAAGK